MTRRTALTPPVRASQLLSTADVAKRLRVTESTVLAFVADGELEAINLARSGKPRLRYREETVAALIEARTYRRPA